MASAHAQDFERRKRPEQMHPSSGAQGTNRTPDDTSEEGDDNDDAGDADASGDADENLAHELPFTGTRRISEESG